MSSGRPLPSIWSWAWRGQLQQQLQRINLNFDTRIKCFSAPSPQHLDWNIFDNTSHELLKDLKPLKSIVIWPGILHTFTHKRVPFWKYNLSKHLFKMQNKNKNYLNPQQLGCGARRRQVFQLPCPLVGEHSSCCLILSVPLNRPASIQKILAGVITSQHQEIASFCHFLN